ncbi:MAG TPA: FxsC protein, partial [Pyrinomonadaceae bacterium]
LAEHIARQAQDHNLPALPGKPPAMKDVQSAFHPTPASPRTSPPVPAAAAVAQEEAAALPPDAEPPRIKGPSAAWYVYLAGRASDYSPVRKYRDCYGEDGFEWQPHLPPEKDKIIGVLTAKAAAARGLMAQVLSPSLNLIEHLRKAEDTNTVTVLVIDPWSVRVGKFNELMRSYDRERFDNCEVIIVWNDADGETPAQSAALKKELVEALGRNFRTVREVDRASVQSEKKFRQKLSAIIGAVQGRLKDKARAARRLPSNGGESFFNINGV